MFELGPLLLSWLAVAGCILIVSFRGAVCKLAGWGRRDVPKLSGGDIPTLDGNELYYDRTRWPQYEASFNLRLSRLYGPVIRIELGPQSPLARLIRWLNARLCSEWRSSDTTILINSLQGNEGTLKGLLNSCASRGPSIAAGKYLSRGQRMVLQPYGQDWTRHRKAFALLLTKDKVKNQWAKALRFEALVMVERISSLGSPTGSNGTALVDEVSRFTASSVLQVAYALRTPTPEEPVIKELEVVSQNIASAFTTGKYWVEAFPLLDIFPAFLSPWKRKLMRDHEFESGVFSRLLQSVEERLAGNETATESVISVEECGAAQLLDRQNDHQVDRDGVAYLAAGLFEAGTQTTAMSINTFLLAAACYPDMTRRAQGEIDSLLKGKYGGAEAVPSFEDLEQLPYLAAVVKETLRLTPTGSSGVGHTPSAAKPLSCDLKDKDGASSRRVQIPAGATVLANIYGLHHDAKAFPDPWCFSPDRWLSSQHEENNVSRVSLDHRNANFAFGFGKRICPGGALASYSMSMATALLLLCFDFDLTDMARDLRAQMESQNREELGKWTTLFPAGGQKVLNEEASLGGAFEDEQDYIGKVLIDAHITFKLSRGQLDQCIRLRPRGEGRTLQAVRETLTKIPGQSQLLG